MRNLTVVLGLVLVLGLTGCTTVQKGAIIGGGVGAGTGAIWAHNAQGNLSIAEASLVGMAGGGLLGALIGDMLDECKTKEDKPAMQKSIDDLKKQLADRDKTISDLKKEIDELKKKGVETTVTKDGQIRFTILNEILFDSGKDVVKADGKKALDAVADVVQKNFATRKLNVEGHTDTDPIKVSKWKSNWELSAGRSLAVAHYLMDVNKIAPERFSAQAFSQYVPVASNDTKEGKLQNRRAVICVMPEAEIVKERSK